MSAAERTDGDPWIGRKVDDRYEVAELLGTGGAGAVYRARSLRIPKDFAIKIISLPTKSKKKKQALERIRQEVMALARINHPHVVGIIEAARLDENHIAIVTEFIEGKNFDRACLDGDLEMGEILEIAIQISMALQAVHSEGMLHRDVKPENVLVRRIEGGALHACLVDFGIVKSQDAAEITRGFIGTPAYAPPEMVTDDDEIGPATDLFGVGSLIYFALEGKGPFAHENVWTSLRMHEDWNGPDTDSYSVSGELKEILFDLMARDIGDRPSSAVEVVERLRSVREDGADVSRLDHGVSAHSHSFAVGPRSVVWRSAEGIRRLDIEKQLETEIDHIPAELVPAAVGPNSILCVSGSNVDIYRDDRTHRVIQTDFDEITAAALDGDQVWIAGSKGELLRVVPDSRDTFMNGNGAIKHIALDEAGGIALATDERYWTATVSAPLEPLRSTPEVVRQFFTSRDGFLLGVVTDDEWKVIAWRTGDVHMKGARRPKALAYALAGRDLVAIVSDGAGLSTVSTIS